MLGGYEPALVFVGIVLAISVTYAVAVLLGRRNWAARIRPANVRLAAGLCVVALVLATPLVDFGALSTRDQLARLQSGQVPPEEFDWAALRFDFGPAGRRALAELSRRGGDPVRELAARALEVKDRWVLAEQVRTGRNAGRLSRSLRVLPGGAAPPPPLTAAVSRLYNVCATGPCTLFWAPGSRDAVVVGFPCETCQAGLTRLVPDGKGGWAERSVTPDITDEPPADQPAQQRAAAAGQVEVRTVPRRQVFVGGQPVGPAFP
jgi:hypothetical protein